MTEEHAELSIADAECVLQHGAEHRLQSVRRARHDTQHVGGGGLLRKRFAQLVEQSGILDGDDGLNGEAGKQLDLPIAKWPHFLAEDDNHADKLALLEQGDADHRPGPGELREFCTREAGRRVGVARLLPHVGDLHWPSGQQNTPERRFRAGPDHRVAAPFLHERLGHPVHGDRAQGFTFGSVKDAEPRLAEAGRIRQDRLEHRLEVSGRAGDDPQHFGGSRLLLPRLLKFACLALKLFLRGRTDSAHHV
jgi:hypothetical protein